jgi:hypothetical protein
MGARFSRLQPAGFSAEYNTSGTLFANVKGGGFEQA